MSRESSSSAAVARGVVSAAISRSLRMVFSRSSRKSFSCSETRLSRTLPCAAARASMSGGVAASLEHVDEAFHRLDGLLGLAQLPVQAGKLGAGVRVVGVGVERSRAGSAPTAGAGPASRTGRPGGCGPALSSGCGREVALDLRLGLLVLACLRPQQGEVEAEVLVGEPRQPRASGSSPGPAALRPTFHWARARPSSAPGVRGVGRQHRLVLLHRLGVVLEGREDGAQAQARVRVGGLQADEPAQLLDRLGEPAVLLEQRRRGSTTA